MVSAGRPQPLRSSDQPSRSWFSVCIVRPTLYLAWFRGRDGEKRERLQLSRCVTVTRGKVEAVLVFSLVYVVAV